MNPRLSISVLLMLFLAAQSCWGADTVPADVQQPGTQPQEIAALAPPSNCASCHAPSNAAGLVAPSPSWSGSPMAHAGRDPIFWASMAIAEQDFDGSGDLCLRCHSTSGWIAGRSTPTDGSGLLSQDADGVDCEFCHRMTPPNDSDPVLQGVQNAPFLANDLGDPDSNPSHVLSYLGTGMTSLWAANKDRLGPYKTPEDANPKHGAWFSSFYRSVDYCGTCHDVSNPVVGNLAHNNGAQATGDPVYTDTTDPSGTGPGQLGGKVDDKAAFNNQPYKYGVIERTFSEYKASLLPKTLVSDYSNLPTDLQAGAIKAARDAALLAGQGGNYADGTPRYFSCQTCHMSAAVGRGAHQGKVPVRKDLPVHDLTGGNYWVGPTIQYLDSLVPSKLRLGTGLTETQITELNDAAGRARRQLNMSASLKVDGNRLTVTNLTGHKLITGYPEGRRMWLNIRWYDASDGLLREDGVYGPLVDGSDAPVMVTDPATDTQVQVRSLLNLNDANSKVYEAHYGMTHEWAEQLSDLGSPTGMVLAYDRLTGIPTLTLGELEGKPDGTKAETFHFVLNNVVLKDNRIPPHGMDREEARKRNILPVPATQYGGGLSGSYNYWDEVQLNPPVGADHAQIELKYQPTSWEYVQFLYLANDGSKTFLQNEGQNLLEAWIHTGMAEPHIMASTSWYESGDLQFGSATYNVDENGGSVTVSVTRTGGSYGAASVSYSTADDSATAGSDYTTKSGTLNWTDGDKDAKSFEVAIADDAVVEGNEVFTIDLSGETGASLGSPSNTSVTILDDEVAQPGFLQFDPATYSVNENAGSVTVSVTRTGGSAGAASVSYSTADDSATVGSDYASTSGTLNWTDGDKDAKSFEVAIADDAVVEGNEVFTIDLSGETGASLGSQTSASVTILDDEVAQPGFLQFDPATYSVNENGGSVTISVTRTGGSYGAVSVSYTTADGSATAGSDYTVKTGTLNWADGDSTKKSFAVTITNDAVVEGSEVFTIDLSGETGASLGTQISAAVTILDDDVAPSGDLQFSSATYSVDENAGSVTVSVTRTGGSAGAASVSYTTADGSATAGSDYTSTTGTLNWADGNSDTKTFAVTIANDAAVEGNEEFTVNLSGETGASLGTQISAAVTILDDDVAPPGVLQFSPATYSVNENGGSVTISVTRTGGSYGAASVSYTTADGSATAGSDYTAKSGTLTWVDGNTDTKSFEVAITDDAVVEGGEAFTINLSDVVGASLGTQTSASVTIVNNCDGDGKVADLDGGEFKESDPVTCQTSDSISALRVTVQPQAQVTFISRLIGLGEKFSVKPLGIFSVKSAP